MIAIDMYYQFLSKYLLRVPVFDLNLPYSDNYIALTFLHFILKSINELLIQVIASDPYSW